MKDINGVELEIGDWIQGYNNRKYASDKTRLYPTSAMKLREYFGDTFERHPLTGGPWVWKLNVETVPLELNTKENKFEEWMAWN